MQGRRSLLLLTPRPCHATMHYHGVHIRRVSISNPLCCQMCDHLSFAVEVPPEPDLIRAPCWRDVVTGCADLATTRGLMADGDASTRESRRVNSRLSFQVTTADFPDWAPREKACSRTRSIEAAVPPTAWCMSMALPAPHSGLTAHASQLRVVFVDRYGDGSGGIIVFWQRPKVIDGTSTAWVHAPISSEFVCLLREEVTRSQARPAEAFECVQVPPGLRGGDAPSLDPRTGAHHILISHPASHLQGVVNAMLRVFRARWTVCKGASIPHESAGIYALGSRIERRSKLAGTGGARVDAFVEARVGDGEMVDRT
jgi:hypothetical protein